MPPTKVKFPLAHPPMSNNTTSNANNNSIPNETDSSSDSPSPSSEGTSHSGTHQPQRRSARLMKRQRDNEDIESESGRGSEIENSSSRVKTQDTENGRTAGNERSSNENENENNNEHEPASSEPITRTTNRTSSSDTSNQGFPMPIVFSIGISRTPQTGAAAASVLPPDIHWIFNTDGNPSAEELQELIRNSSSRTTGGVGIRSASFVIPLGAAANTANSASRMGTRASINQADQGDTFNPLNFARQMFQLITRARSTPATPTDTESPASAGELPLREFFGNIVNLMTTPGSNGNGNNTAEGSIATDEIELILNDFITRVFGNTEAIPTGLTPERINALPVMDAGSEEFDCAICRETAKAGAEKCVKLPCDHGFHAECIEPWLKRISSCPICRSVIKEE